ncbi:MAG TPA: polysaccharide deacetylase family protein [Ferruginibacter sp.]|jgi:peptidoglycan/xylan/chitin deacetylase (PgdA/CDA1 family)|nr:polysaccharide deacetylase family protein [Ferruginibacter sp.]
MLNFKNTNITFIILLIILVGYNFTHSISPFFYIGLFICYSLILFYGCYYISSNFFIKVICSAATDKKQIAISFDDGPATSFTPEILNVLQRHNIKATFFCIGNRIAGNEEILMQIHQEGHIIGNHSYSHHFWFDLFATKKVMADLQQMDTITKDLIGVQPKLFRPPYGVLNPNIKNSIIAGNYIPIGWSVRSFDTVIGEEKRLFNKITKALQPGAIYLFHDTSETTLNILPLFIQYVKQQDYEIVRLDKMLHLQPYA